MRARQDRNPILLVGAVANVLGDARAHLKVRSRCRAGHERLLLSDSSSFIGPQGRPKTQSRGLQRKDLLAPARLGASGIDRRGAID